MTSQPLPERANLEQLKKQAKSLLQAARANDPGALERFRILPPFAGKSIEELAGIGLALHDAQAVIAREHGFKSWNRLREHVEERSLSFAAAVDEFVRCATGGAAERALRLLALHPGIAHASLETELVLGDAVAVRARLEKDPNLPWSERGDAPLHVAAERLDLTIVELLVRHGADVNRRRADGRTAHTLAELNGNTDIAGWLLAHGAHDELSLLERFVAACTRGDRATAERMLRDHPTLPDELRTEHHRIVHVPAERGDANVLDSMLACGFDPNVKDHEGVTALHRAAMAGRAESVRVLLAHGADVNGHDDMFAATPLLWAAHGWSEHAPPGADHPAVARLLISAGSSLEWVPPEKAPHPESTQEKLVALLRVAGA